MTNHRQASIVGVRLDFPQFADGKENVFFCALVLWQAAGIQRSRGCDERHVGRQVVLDADDEITTRSKKVCEKGIFGILYRVAF